MSALYKLPSVLNPSRSVWVIDCAECGETIRLGPGSRAGIERLIRAVGGSCNDCTRGDA